MADTFTPLLGLRLPEDGGDLNTWGDLFNSDVITAVENAWTKFTRFTGQTGGTLTLTLAQQRLAGIDLRGSLVSNLTVVLAANQTGVLWVINNCTLNGFNVFIKTAAGSPALVGGAPNSGVRTAYCDGADGVFVD